MNRDQYRLGVSGVSTAPCLEPTHFRTPMAEMNRRSCRRSYRRTEIAQHRAPGLAVLGGGVRVLFEREGPVNAHARRQFCGARGEIPGFERDVAAILADREAQVLLSRSPAVPRPPGGSARTPWRSPREISLRLKLQPAFSPAASQSCPHTVTSHAYRLKGRGIKPGGKS